MATFLKNYARHYNLYLLKLFSPFLKAKKFFFFKICPFARLVFKSGYNQERLKIERVWLGTLTKTFKSAKFDGHPTSKEIIWKPFIAVALLYRTSHFAVLLHTNLQIQKRVDHKLLCMPILYALPKVKQFTSYTASKPNLSRLYIIKPCFWLQRSMWFSITFWCKPCSPKEKLLSG